MRIISIQLFLLLANWATCTLAETTPGINDLGFIIPLMTEKYQKLGVMNPFLNGIWEKHNSLTHQQEHLSWTDLANAGFSDQELDFLAHELCKCVANARMVIIWPRAKNHTSYITQEIKKCGTVIYAREVTLKGKALAYLLRAIPEKAGSVNTYLHYYSNNQPTGDITVLLTEFSNLETAINCKKRIRQHLKLNPLISALHITDTQEQTVDMAQIFFNKNSINYLNAGLFDTKFEKFNFLREKYTALLKQHRLEDEYCCVDGSAILSMHGIRDINVDFDFITYYQDLDFPKVKYAFKQQLLGPIDLHNKTCICAGVDQIETVFNPQFYFYYQGIKYATLERIRHFKFNQNREVDRKDVLSIDKLISRI